MKEQQQTSIVLNFQEITDLDCLDTRFHGIRELSLNHNRICDLQNLAQFQDLECLAIASNHLHDIDEIRHILKLASTLEELYVAGNAICQHPDYRSLFIEGLPQLRILDGLPVTRKEKQSIVLARSLQSKILPALETLQLAHFTIDSLLASTQIQYEL